MSIDSKQETFSTIVTKLQDPQLVIRVQEFFGIRYCSKDAGDDAGKSKEAKLEVTNKFWYNLFWFGTILGDELFYATMIPFWFWNVDSAVARRVVLLWSINMYVGQVLKDIFKIERPGHPVIKLQRKWALEYGFPSTHAMVGLQIPFSVVYFSYQRYDISLGVGVVICLLWCTTVCVSRIYLGMHSVLDILGGLILCMGLLIPATPIVDMLDIHLLSNPYSPLLLLVLSIGIITYYPNPGKWTPTRGDTTLTTSFAFGVYFGAWINYQLGILTQTAPFLQPPYSILWPSPKMAIMLVVRTFIGLLIILATRTAFKKIGYSIACFLLGRDPNEVRSSENSLENKHKIMAELTYKFLTYGMIGVDVQFLAPALYKLIGIGRPDFFTEV